MWPLGDVQLSLGSQVFPDLNWHLQPQAGAAVLEAGLHFFPATSENPGIPHGAKLSAYAVHRS